MPLNPQRRNHHKDLVCSGYDVIAETYLRIRNHDGEDVRLLDVLAERLPEGVRVLDAGCGTGVPVTRILSQRFQVTGVDFSAAQIDLARQLVPDVEFIRADMTTIGFLDDAFDAIVSYYAIIHVPREDHPTLLRNFQRMLKPGGLLLVSMGADDNPGDTEENWLAAGEPMYWSHYDHSTNLRLIEQAGFHIIWERIVTEDEEFGGGAHLFVLGEGRGLGP